VHPETPAVAREVRSQRSLDSQLDVLGDRYAGAPCVIVTCGPSLGTFDPAVLRASLDGVLTIVVKQAVDVVGPHTDFHCWNPFNVRRYARGADDTIRCFVDEPTGRMIQHNPADMTLSTGSTAGSLDESLAAELNFDDYVLAKNHTRPFGPGIVYELCIYLAVHLGVSRIVTIGWDIAGADGKNTHFDDRPDEQQFFRSERRAAPERPAASRRGSETVRRPLRWARTRRLHRAGEVYNRTRVLPGETELVASSTEALARWLGEVGVRLNVATDSPFISPTIPRWSLAEAPDQIRSLGGA